MSLDTVKRDPNDAASDKWLLLLPGGLSLISNKTTDFDLPGVNTDGTVGPRGGASNMLSIPSDTLTWDPIVFTFIVDETYSNYIEVLKLQFSQLTGDEHTYLFDCTVMPLSNRGRDQGLEFNYLDCRVSNISTVALDTTANVKTLTCTMTLISGGFQIRKDGKVVVSTEF